MLSLLAATAFLTRFRQVDAIGVTHDSSTYPYSFVASVLTSDTRDNFSRSPLHERAFLANRILGTRCPGFEPFLGALLSQGYDWLRQFCGLGLPVPPTGVLRFSFDGKLSLRHP